MTQPHTIQPPRDFPFYDGRPANLTLGGWLMILAGCGFGFAALVLSPLLPGHPPASATRWIGVGLFVLLPLLGLRLAARQNWTAVFPGLRWKDVWIGLAFVPVTWAVSASVALLVQGVALTAANPVAGMLTNMTTGARIDFFASTAPQLFGEELITILPFLALLALFRSLKTPRLFAILLAWIGSALIFGALHLPTYDWHVVQAFGIIGAARLTLTLPYLITKSPWSSTITHVVNDWSLFGLMLILPGLGGHS